MQGGQLRAVAAQVAIPACTWQRALVRLPHVSPGTASRGSASLADAGSFPYQLTLTPARPSFFFFLLRQTAIFLVFH